MPICREPVSLRGAIRVAVERLNEALLRDQEHPPKSQELPDWAFGHSEEARWADFALDELIDQIPEDLIQRDYDGSLVVRERYKVVCPPSETWRDK